MGVAGFFAYQNRQAVIAAEAERHEVAEHLQEASSQRRGHGERLEPPSDDLEEA